MSAAHHLILLVGLLPISAAPSTRVKDLVNIEGVRDNQLLGYGIVVGLNGTGDKQTTVFSAQSLGNLLARMGVQVTSSAILVKNTAAVLVTATLPPFAQPGSRLDVTVAAIGDASNLQGGLLVLTPLKAADGQTYAMAQGSVVTGGFVAGRSGGSSQTVNHPTAGRIPMGAIAEKKSPSIEPVTHVTLQLRQPDYTSAARIAHAINVHFAASSELARAENSGLVTVETPADWKARPVEFISEIQELAVESDQPARVVVNERTGTVVMGREVRIRPVTIMHGALTVEVLSTAIPPMPLGSGASTAPVEEVTATAKAPPAKNISLNPGATIEDLVRALSAIGATPRDIIAILQALRAAGALEADVEVI